jgi:SanA protein
VRRIGFFLASLVALAAAVVLGTNLWLVHDARDEIRSFDGAPPRDVAIVLGSRIRNDGEPSVPLQDRLELALRLWRAKRVERILVSGDRNVRNEDGVMAAWLEARGVPAAAILRDGDGVRTRATMENAARSFHVSSAIVCTHDYHLPRALAWARREHIDAVGVAAEATPYADDSRATLREIGARVLAAWELVAE